MNTSAPTLCTCTYEPLPHDVQWCTPSAAAWRLFEAKTIDRWAGRGAPIGGE